MSNPVKKERLEVPIWHKPYLTIDEATAYTGIGREKLREMTRLLIVHLCYGWETPNDKKRIV